MAPPQLLLLLLAAATHGALAKLRGAPASQKEDIRFPPKEPETVTSLTEQEYRRLKRSALSPVAAERHFHNHFPPWSERPQHACAECEAARGNVSRRMMGGFTLPRLTHFLRAAGDAFVPTPSVGACLSLSLDGKLIGLPGVILSMGIEGELAYDLCVKCFRWKFAAMLGFSFGVSVLGFDMYFSMTLKGELDLRELTCDMAKESYFCRYLYLVLPEYLNRMLNRDSVCHSDSPFEVITAFIEFQWLSLKAWVQSKMYSAENPDYPSSPLIQNLESIQEGMMKYPNLFRALPATAAEEPPTTETSATTPAPSYHRGSFDAVSCPSGTVMIMDIAMCEAAARSFGLSWGGTVSKGNRPRGCYEHDGWFYDDISFNTHGSGGSDSAARPICLNTFSNDALHVQWPTKATIDGKTQYIWMVMSERRLCWSETWPTRAQGADRSFEAMMQLHGECDGSIEVKDLSPDLSAVRVEGKTVTLPTLRDRGAPLAASFDSQDGAQVWRDNLVQFVEQTRADTRELLVSRCLRAELGENAEAYCTLEVPGQLWASSYQSYETAQPKWGRRGEGEGTGLRIGGEEAEKGRTSMRVAVHHMSQEMAESYYEWVMSFVVDSPTGDPLSQYLGQARVSVCRASGEAEWAVIHNSKACESNSDGVEVEVYADVSDVGKCQQQCAALPGCVAVDFLPGSGRCNLFNTACENPTKSGGTSYRLVQLGCDAVAQPGADPVKIQVPLWIRKDHADSWNPFNWYSGVEVVEAGVIWMDFKWMTTPDVSKVWRPAGSWPEGSAPRMPGLISAAQALFVAFDQWVAKLPTYAQQVGHRLGPYDPDWAQYEDRWLPYPVLTGRFLARWHPYAAKVAQEKEHLEEPPQEVLTCPAPDDAGTFHWLYCEVQFQAFTKNSYADYLHEEFEDTLTSTPCENADLSSEDVDERVVHFQRAMSESVYARGRATTVDFHAEVATSVLNLFVRVVADVQGLWAVYFADDPNWNGDCHSMRPVFDLPYEFGPDLSGGNEHLWEARTQDLNVKQYPAYRAAGLASHRAAWKMSDSENPFCKRAWAGGRIGQDKRINFVKQDPPLSGQDGFVTAPRDLSATMWPHLWCEVTGAYREANTPGAGGDSGDGKQPPLRRAVRSRTLLYGSSCRQIRRVKVEEGESISKSWRRFDCEEATLTPPFMTLFPRLVKRVVGTASTARGSRLEDLGVFGKLGTVVEDVLQCAGRISVAMREFARDPAATDISEACDGSKRHLDMLEEADGQDEDFLDLVHVVQARTQDALKVLKEFVDSLRSSSFADQLSEDFHKLFAYHELLDRHGSLLYGEAWQAGLNKAVEELGTAAAVEARAEKSKEAALLAVLDSQDPATRGVTALFPLPVQYRALTEVSIGFGSQLPNLCEKGIPASLTFAVRAIAEGLTFKPEREATAQVGAYRLCIRGGLTPLPFVPLVVAVEGCWAKRTDVPDEAWETTWRLEIRAVIREREMSLFDGASSLTEAIVKQQSSATSLGFGDIGTVNRNLGWQLARRVLMDPYLLLKSVGAAASMFSGGGGGSGLSFVGDAVSEIAGSVERNIVAISTDVVAYSAYYAMSGSSGGGGGGPSNVLFDLKAKSLDILEAAVELKQVGDAGPWTTSFDVAWTRRGSVGLEIEVGENIAAAEMQLSMSSRYDFSQIFNVIFDVNALPLTFYDCCLLCLQHPTTNFCRSRDGEPTCIEAESANCSGTIVTELSGCSETGVGLGEKLSKRQRAAGLCQGQADKDYRQPGGQPGGSELGVADFETPELQERPEVDGLGAQLNSANCTNGTNCTNKTDAVVDGGSRCALAVAAAGVAALMGFSHGS